MSEKLFSIITPVYNGEQYIEETIKSVLSQTYRDYEYVIVDSESKDRTIDIINKYKNDVHKVICEKDNGMYDAIDKAIKSSRAVSPEFCLMKLDFLLCRLFLKSMFITRSS